MKPFFILFFLLTLCNGMQRMPRLSHKDAKNQSEEIQSLDFGKDLLNFIQSYQKVNKNVSIASQDPTIAHKSSKDRVNELDRSVSAAGVGESSYIYGGGQKYDNYGRRLSETSEFKINTGFNIGLRWRPIRTKQKIKKVLFFLPKQFLSKTKHYLDKIGSTKGDGEYYESFEEDYKENYDYDDDYEEYESYSGYERYEDDSTEAHTVKIQRLNIGTIPTQKTPNFRDSLIARLEDHAFFPQSLEYSSPRGTLLSPTEHSQEDAFQSLSVPSDPRTFENDVTYVPKPESGSSRNSENRDDNASFDSEHSAGDGTDDTMHAPIPLTSTDGAISMLETLEPDYVLVATSILVNKICDHMPNHFRSDPQEIGKMEEILVVVFDDPVQAPKGRFTSRIDQHVFFPGDPLFSSAHRQTWATVGVLIWPFLAATLLN
ncbi:hypothetical protein PUMCH_001806 [Australozyma saopauloensis]|uniref:Uncharacterized protein n=1 Tax=Australozyma saopauloensis TaxID=291208 RepID=A0AAX4H7L8_9ASCO|nr:hypothetical protein PUMCH_001806 [[Candida] saopauloensis]